MKKSRRTYNGVHLNKKSNTQDVVEQSLTIYENRYLNQKSFIFLKDYGLCKIFKFQMESI